MDYRITFIIPNIPVVESVKSALEKIGLDYPVYLRSTGEAVELARELIPRGVKLIVSPGLTLENIRKELAIPAIDLPFSGLDALATARAALQLPGRIVHLGTQSLHHYIQRSLTLIGENPQRIDFYQLKLGRTVEEQAQDMIDAGYNVFIGGYSMVAYVKQAGKYGLEFDADELIIEATVQNAQTLLNTILQREQRNELDRAILQASSDAIIAIDQDRRKAVMRAHSATHLLDKALRTVLGDHVHQAGSLVEPDRLRFDFTHFSAMTAEEVARVVAMVNEAVLEGYDIHTDVLPIEEAKKRGAIALFGEKYGDTVRVVDMGHGYSVEFCGGTHLDNTAKVGLFHISSEFSVASGVRRIEATTGRASLEKMNRNGEMLIQAAEVLKAKPGELLERAQAIMGEIKQSHQALEKLQARLAAGETERLMFGTHNVGPLRVLTATVPDADGAKLRQMGDMLKEKGPNMVAVLAGVSDGKITFLAVCGKEAVAKGIKAGEIIKTIAPICGGKGGGKPDSAMGGGSDILKLDNALAALDDFVAGKLK